VTDGQTDRLATVRLPQS